MNDEWNLSDCECNPKIANVYRKMFLKEDVMEAFNLIFKESVCLECGSVNQSCSHKNTHLFVNVNHIKKIFGKELIKG